MTESKNEAIRLLEGMYQRGPKNGTQTENPPEGSIETTFSKMICQWCNGLVLPTKHYSCSAGHTFCAFCGEERFVKHGAKCMIEILEEQLDFGSPKNVTLQVPRIVTPYYRMNGLQTVHFPVCQQQITLQPEDPEWMSPGGCNEVFEGHNLVKNLFHCEEQKKNSQLDKVSENKPEEELPVVSSILKGDLSVDRKMTTPKQLIVCNMNGCSMEMRVKDLGRHIMLDHHVYAVDFGNFERFGNIADFLYIPQSEIKAKRPFYMLIRRCRRSFLFCMEHATDNSDYVGFWIQRISNMENNEEDNGPYFRYNLLMRSENGNMQVVHKNGCIPWGKSINESFGDKTCLKLPISLILNELVLSCVDEKCTDKEKGMGFLVVKFEIMIGNAVGELYWDDAAEDVTSSMESLDTATSGDCTDQSRSDNMEVVQESVNDKNDVADDVKEDEEEAINDDDDEKEDEEKSVNVDDDVDNDEAKGDEEGEAQPLVVNAVEEKSNKMKIWFERIYRKGENFSPKYTP